MPEVSGSLPQSLEVESPACPINACGAPRHYKQNKEAAWRTWVWLPEAGAPGQPHAESDEAVICVSFEIAYMEPKGMSESFHS